ncbi:MAG: cobalamin biosynthesis protein CobD [Nitrospirae bacterium]|nr:cobalamin biosynthesis protein CobD [Nitrospirota bacterium]
MIEIAIFISAYILDLMIGDPRWLPHPVRIIGWAIEKVERVLRSAEVRKCGSTEVKGKILAEKLYGILLVAIIVGATYLIFNALNSLFLTSRFSPLNSYLLLAILVYLTSTTFATHDLITSGKAVINAVNAGEKEDAQNKLGMIVGRDTNLLDNKGILKATIETLSENTSDGIIAPMFYFAIGGLPLAMTYKAINTLDSMVGYKNERYKNFGWAAARLDDIANYIPARITGIMIAASSFILNTSLFTCHLSFKTMLRDGRKHLSPNSGIPEAAMAGALGIRLGGPSMYGGILVEKPYIGEERSEVKEQMYDHMYLNATEDAISIIKLTSLLGFGFTILLLYLRTRLWN